MAVASAKLTSNNPPERLMALERYYRLVNRGCSPEQTRRDLMLSMEDIAQFDFSVFENNHPPVQHEVRAKARSG
jgi:hypothetical protein